MALSHVANCNFFLWNFIDSTFLFLLQSTLTSTQLASYYYFSWLKYYFSSFSAHQSLNQSFNSVKESIWILSSCYWLNEEIGTFLPFWICIPLFHFDAISKRIKLQKWDCAHLVDFSMQFSNLFFIFYFSSSERVQKWYNRWTYTFCLGRSMHAFRIG